MAIHKPQKETPRTGAAYDFLRASIEAQTKIEVGTIIKGTISEIKGNEVLVNIGYKSDGIVPASEFEDISAVKVGDEIDVFVVALENDRGDVVQLSKSRADEKLRWDAVLAKYTEGGIVHGTISSKVRGGLIVKVDGVEAFLPGSQIDVTPIHDPDPFIGQDFDFKLSRSATSAGTSSFPAAS